MAKPSERFDMGQRSRVTSSTQIKRDRGIEDVVHGDDCAYRGCSASPQSQVEFPVVLCKTHLVTVLTRSQELTRTLFVDAPLPKKQKRQVVYYLRSGTRIKIGTTANINQRIRAIPHDELMGTEPGGHGLEHMRHLEFAADRISGEWFNASPRLMRHIRQLSDV